MDELNWLQVESLTTYEVAPDGSSVKLNLTDSEGKPGSVIVPLEPLRVLATSMQKIVRDALARAAGDGDLRLVHSVEQWKLERASDPDYAILTLSTPDRLELSFAIKDVALARMAELMNDFHIEAFPEGLQFH